MKRIIQVVAVLAALSAFPALADESSPAPGSTRDPFSQTYAGNEQKPQETRPCDRSCSCDRHHGESASAQKAEAPRFTDAG